jgi:HAD superfamily hydrolase (TIGR01509 family)
MLKRLLDEAGAVLFDFDGVLVDSEPFYYRSYNMAFEKRGHTIKEEEYWEYWTSKGEGIPGEVRRYGLDISQDEIDTMYAERCENFTAFCRQGSIPFYPGMLEVLNSLKEKGMPCAIASSSFEPDILIIFEKAGYKAPPCTVVGRRKGLRPKPWPDIYVYAAGALGKEPASCLVIEDAHKGLEAAHTASMRCVILKNERNRELDYPGADLVIEDHEAFALQVGAWRGSRGS